MNEPQKLRVAVLISGGGTTFKNLLDWQRRDRLDVEFALVVSNNSNAAGLDFAEQAKIDSTVINHRDFDSVESFSDVVFHAIAQANVDLVVMGGFLRRLKIPSQYTNRVINIHPSLIPAFCGKGHYGRHVHQAVLDYGCKISGCTVHFVDDHYDHGPIIAQATVPVLATDDASSLGNRVFEAECELYPNVIQGIADGEIHVEGRSVVWKRGKQIHV